MVGIHPEAMAEPDEENRSPDAIQGAEAIDDLGRPQGVLRRHDDGPGRQNPHPSQAETAKGKDDDGRDDITLGHEVSFRWLRVSAFRQSVPTIHDRGATACR